MNDDYHEMEDKAYLLKKEADLLTKQVCGIFPANFYGCMLLFMGRSRNSTIYNNYLKAATIFVQLILYEEAAECFFEASKYAKTTCTDGKLPDSILMLQEALKCAEALSCCTTVMTMQILQKLVVEYLCIRKYSEAALTEFKLATINMLDGDYSSACLYYSQAESWYNLEKMTIEALSSKENSAECYVLDELFGPAKCTYDECALCEHDQIDMNRKLNNVMLASLCGLLHFSINGKEESLSLDVEKRPWFTNSVQYTKRKEMVDHYKQKNIKGFMDAFEAFYETMEPAPTAIRLKDMIIKDLSKEV